LKELMDGRLFEPHTRGLAKHRHLAVEQFDKVVWTGRAPSVRDRSTYVLREGIRDPAKALVGVKDHVAHRPCVGSRSADGCSDIAFLRVDQRERRAYREIQI